MGFFNDDFDRIFDAMALGFGKPTKLIFNTNGIRDMMPTCWSKTEEGYRCILKTLGINEKDILVEVIDYGIKVSGKSEIEGQIYDTLIELPVSEDVMDNITNIIHKTINGLTFVDISVERPKKKKILINGK